MIRPRAAPLVALVGVVGLVGLVGLVALAPPAAAHGGGPGVPPATNYRARLLSVTPRIPGLEATVVGGDDRLELANHTEVDAVVLGYQGEPYLRVGPSGVFENRRSPATYLNRSRHGGGAVPADADPSASPSWRRVSTGWVARWHDHRAHWMGAEDPPAVRRSPGNFHLVIPRWTVDVRHGSTQVELAGDLAWVPGPSPVPWLVVVAALVALGIALGLSPRWAGGLATAVAALVVVDLVHSLGVGFVDRGSLVVRLARVLGGGYSLLGWAAAFGAIRLLTRRSLDGLYLAAFAGLVLAAIGGLLDVDTLARSQVPSALPAVVVRATVALSLGLGGGIVAGSVVAAVGNRRQAPAAPSPPAREEQAVAG